METRMSLKAVRLWFARLKGMEPGSMVGDGYVNRACDVGLPFHRDPVTGIRFWLESELRQFVQDSANRTRNLKLRQKPGRRAM